MRNKHRLFVYLYDISDPNKNNVMMENFKWAIEIEKSIKLANKATNGSLSIKDRKKFEKEYKKMILTLNINCKMSEKAVEDYKSYTLPKTGPLNARDICDYIFARIHRKFYEENNIVDWRHTSFLKNPVGVPRTRYGTVKYNRSYRHIDKATRYDLMAKNGLMEEHPTLLIYKDSSWVYPENLHDKVKLIKTTKNYWRYIHPKRVEGFWPLINDLYEKVLLLKDNKKLELEEALGYIAQIHWWFSQVVPYRRGSAAISDMLAKHIQDTLSISTPFWKVSVSPDFEAYCRPLQEYIKAYPGFFEERPKLLKLAKN